MFHTAICFSHFDIFHEQAMLFYCHHLLFWSWGKGRRNCNSSTLTLQGPPFLRDKLAQEAKRNQSSQWIMLVKHKLLEQIDNSEAKKYVLKKGIALES